MGMNDENNIGDNLLDILTKFSPKSLTKIVIGAGWKYSVDAFERFFESCRERKLYFFGITHNDIKLPASLNNLSEAVEVVEAAKYIFANFKRIRNCLACKSHQKYNIMKLDTNICKEIMLRDYLNTKTIVAIFANFLSL
ncbi:hypothetical protein RhiirA5_438131 [Rhizophagus irregularis]|uniref:Uncharacterized protein n=1 Tax=Rhizophagus irregularis TaxID=588596 RepID=A0A2N0NJI8_9GLOM|nr:hypothetical protein RhiirA5_438131 [Rhizophagus irregularis]